MNEEAINHLRDQTVVDRDDVLEALDLEDSDDEYSHSRPIYYNPYRHVRFESEETRDLVKQYGIRDLCKQFFPPNTDEYEYLQPIA